jgi:putative SOS response-associated peptidase YedK
MCFHNSINTDKQHLERKYKKKLKEPSLFQPIFHANAFEFSAWPIVSNSSENIEMMNWGLIPSWANTPQAAAEIRTKTLNARIETITEKPSFKNAKRCIVPSSGFFEWQEIGKNKIPYFIYLPNSPVFSMAGIYDSWINQNGVKTYSFSILTTSANELMASIHNTKLRMPVILSVENEQNWLENKLDLAVAKVPFDQKMMKAHTIGSIINSKNHNVPEVFLPKTIELVQQINLF